MRQALAFIASGLIGLTVLAAAPAPQIAAAAEAKSPIVFAAASLKDALDSVNQAWEKKTGHHALISYAATSSLAKQIDQGAPADVFLSADLRWMNYVEKKKLIKPATRSNLLANQLVLIAPKSSTIHVKIKKGFPLAKLLGQGKLAMANVDAVPAGIYGKESLVSLGVWNSVKANVAQAQNVRAALALVARGEVPLGIVYRTDAIAESRVRVVDVFPAKSHKPIIYPAAILASSKNPQAKAFLAFVESAAAKPLFKAQGFTVLPQGAK